MEMHPIFKFREQATEEILALLESVTLGTDGAHYRHLDTRERISEADVPLFLSMERNERVLGNITFCRREKNWYIRYFAFENSMQSKGSKKSSAKSGFLKSQLNNYFDHQLALGEVDSFYAYIDPRNVKSLWMSENFGFETVSTIATQTYSSKRNPEQRRVRKIENPTEIPSEVLAQFQGDSYFFRNQLEKGPHYAIRDESGQLLAFAKTTNASWEIKRLPGKMGGFLVKALPFIPFLNQLIRPKKHDFVVPEAVFSVNNDPGLLKELFDGILSIEKKRVIIWWVDDNNNLYQAVKSKMKWGLLHKIIGVNKANLVVRSNQKSGSLSKASYTSGFDFV